MKISVVVIVYNIQREAPRTLLSLAVPYQQNVDPADYEVIVVENGGKNRLDPDKVRALGPNFQYHYIEDAKPSPAAAINYGIRHAKGEMVGVMIDGARICSPGVVSQAIEARRLHPRPVIAVLGFYLGDGYQRDTIRRGYTKAIEDELLDSIDWPRDGYKLFEIGVPDECSRFFGPLYESNCIFLPKVMWDEMGGYDERFDVPGGGLVNLDTLRRAVELPDAKHIVILGEATFHQVHGGVATNTLTEAFEPMLAKWFAQYKELRGYEFLPSTCDRMYFGTIPEPLTRHMCVEMNEMRLPPSFAAERAMWKQRVHDAEMKVSPLEAAVENLRSQCEQLNFDLEIMQQSHSWLLTKPLRSAFQRVNALRDRITKLGNGSNGSGGSNGA
jgi:glycosyltransferase involved in cell wall biosynthesis